MPAIRDIAAQLADDHTQTDAIEADLRALAETDPTETYDPQDLTDAQAAALTEAYRASADADPVADTRLSDLADAHRTYHDTAEAADSARVERDALLRSIAQAGVSVRDIRLVTGLSRERIYQIRDARR